MAIAPVYEPYDVRKLGAVIRALRKQAGLTQQQLLDKVNVQLPPADAKTCTFISYIENGKRHMSRPAFKAVAQALNVSGAWLAIMAFRCDSSSIRLTTTARNIDAMSKTLQVLIKDSLDLPRDSALE